MIIAIEKFIPTSPGDARYQCLAKIKCFPQFWDLEVIRHMDKNRWRRSFGKWEMDSDGAVKMKLLPWKNGKISYMVYISREEVEKYIRETLT